QLPADVVAVCGPRLARPARHRCTHGVDGDRDAGLDERLDDRDGPLELLDRWDPAGSRPGRLATDVDDVGTLGEEVASMGGGILRIEPESAVAERVGRDVENAHDEGPGHVGLPQRGLPPRSRAIASARVAGLRSWPRTAEVMVLEPGLRTPRIDMQRCSAS